MIKYKAGYFLNNGYDDYGNQSILHIVIIGLEEGEAKKLPSQATIWRRHGLKGSYVDRLVDGKMKRRPLKIADIFIVPEEESRYSLYQRTYVRKG